MMKKKVLALLLSLALCFSLAAQASAVSEVTPQQVYQAITALKAQYPEGTPWTNDSYYAWKGGIYSGGYGCAGFAFLLSDAAFGDLPARVLTSFTFSDIQAGDILRINNGTHSVIVLEVHDSSVVIAEGNFNNSVHWGRTLTKEEVLSAEYLITRYPETPADAPVNADGFTDVPASHWAYSSVMSAAEKGYVNGVGGGAFHPEGTVTYAEFVSMLTRAFYPEQLEGTAADPWYAPYMQAARATGMLTGTAAADASSNAVQEISRYEMAQLMANIMAQKGQAVSSGEKQAVQSQISDWGSVPANYQDSVAACYALGLLTGYDDSTFSGSDNMTRAQACVVLNRLDQVVTD